MVSVLPHEYNMTVLMRWKNFPLGLVSRSYFSLDEELCYAKFRDVVVQQLNLEDKARNALRSSTKLYTLFGWNSLNHNLVAPIKPLPVAHAADSAANVLADWNALYDAYNEVACLMLGSMTPELHRQFENYSPYEMLLELKSMFEKQAGVERFVRNYNMHNMEKTIGELHAILIEYEKGLPKKAETPQVMVIKGGKIQKANKKSLKAKGNGKAKVKGKDKQFYIPKPKNPKLAAKEHSVKDDTCHHYKEVGHWKRNCHVYLAELLKKHKQVASASSSGRATDLLGIIHTNVCGPLRHVSRQGASYFITFTDDYSRYGYVYLLKHKHEVFETFKVFKNEVENKLGKTIKALRLDRDGEYVSQEFKDYLKACRIIQQLTPPYKPQHNGVSERRNHTFLDMVRSMMNLTTFPYAEFFEKNLITQEVSRRAIDPEEIQDEDTSPSEITSKIPMEVKGFEPPQGEVISIRRVDYEETFSPVSDIRDIRILISIVAFYDYKIWKMDVKIAFLNGYLDEDIYMVQPEGFVDPNHPRKVCKLQRSIYGLKQASRSWNKRFDEEIKKFGFAQNLDEPCVYQKASGSNVTFLILYVNDIIIIGNHILSLQSVIDYLGKCFAMKDLGEATLILGIKIYRDRSKRLIGLGQNTYMDKILKRYKMDNSKRSHILIQERLALNKTHGASTPKEVKRMQNVPYPLAVGSIMYAVRCTRPDIAFAQNITSRFQQTLGECHWSAVKNILKYLRNTKDMFLVYGGNSEAKLRVD
uniref:Retrotransposon protein, putative, Ty1-copia subclass n=1 Tax=Tanacetum cinerariifolium TaxID=118510 RepID=A0A699GS18_TANCI|nr:retrotransposon protein, putative, Ty1-copia subclass [Tanacetum cinerariifolium]